MRLLRPALVLGLLSLTTVLAHAVGGGHSGGGDVVICQRGGVEATYLADVYQFMMSPLGDLLRRRSEEVSVSELKQRLLLGVRKNNPRLARELESTIDSLEFKEFVPDEKNPRLPELNDDNIKIDPSYGSCFKRQLAIQNIKTRKVVYDAELLKKTSHLEQALFQFHEAFIYLGNTFGLAYVNRLMPLSPAEEFSLLPGSAVLNQHLKDTTKIRQKVLYLLKLFDFPGFLKKGDLKSNIAGCLKKGEKYLFQFSSVIQTNAEFVMLTDQFTCPRPMWFVNDPYQSSMTKARSGHCYWQGTIHPNQPPMEIVFENPGNVETFDFNTALGVFGRNGQVKYEVIKLNKKSEAIAIETSAFLPSAGFAAKEDGTQAFFQPFNVFGFPTCGAN